jgi:hypothetical protein
MLAYHNNPSIKTDILVQLAKRRAAYEFMLKGRYWDSGKGYKYEIIFGIPRMLETLEYKIFEGLPDADAQKWPESFMGSITPWTDLSLVGWKFQYWLLTGETISPGINHPLVRDAVKQCANVLLLLANGDTVTWQSMASVAQSAAKSAQSAQSAAGYEARRAAKSAEESAQSVAWIAAGEVWSAKSKSSSEAWGAAWRAVRAALCAVGAESEPWSAARSTASVAWSAKSKSSSAVSAGWSAGWRAASAAWREVSAARIAAWRERGPGVRNRAAEGAAWSAAKSAEFAAGDTWGVKSAYQRMADKLIDLLEKAPLVKLSSTAPGAVDSYTKSPLSQV